MSETLWLPNNFLKFINGQLTRFKKSPVTNMLTTEALILYHGI